MEFGVAGVQGARPPAFQRLGVCWYGGWRLGGRNLRLHVTAWRDHANQHEQDTKVKSDLQAAAPIQTA